MRYKTHASEHEYVPAEDPSLCKRHIVRASDGEPGVKTYLYTDGSSKGYHNSPDKRSFSGWGYVINSISNARENRQSAYGGMMNASSVEAEFFSVLKGISGIRFPADVHLITDCADVIKCMEDVEATMRRFHEIRSISPSSRSPSERYEMKYLTIFQKIHRELEERQNIRSLSVEWVRAHTLDDFAVLPDPDDVENLDERRLLRRCIGNSAADQEAQKGATQSVKTAVYFLAYPQKHNNPVRHLLLCRKNFGQSWFARETAVKFLKQRPGLLTIPLMEAVFPKKECEQIVASWESKKNAPAIKSGGNPFANTRNTEVPRRVEIAAGHSPN